MTAVANPPTLESLEQRQAAQHLNDLEAKLVAEYAQKTGYTEDHVRKTINLIRGRFSAARIHAFLPILVERAVRQELDR